MTRAEQRAHVQKWYTATVGRHMSDRRLDWWEKQRPEALERAKVYVIAGPERLANEAGKHAQPAGKAGSLGHAVRDFVTHENLAPLRAESEVLIELEGAA